MLAVNVILLIEVAQFAIARTTVKGNATASTTVKTIPAVTVTAMVAAPVLELQKVMHTENVTTPVFAMETKMEQVIATVKIMALPPANVLEAVRTMKLAIATAKARVTASAMPMPAATASVMGTASATEMTRELATVIAKTTAMQAAAASVVVKTIRTAFVTVKAKAFVLAMPRAKVTATVSTPSAVLTATATVRAIANVKAKAVETENVKTSAATTCRRNLKSGTSLFSVHRNTTLSMSSKKRPKTRLALKKDLIASMSSKMNSQLSRMTSNLRLKLFLTNSPPLCVEMTWKIGLSLLKRSCLVSRKRAVKMLSLMSLLPVRLVAPWHRLKGICLRLDPSQMNISRTLLATDCQIYRKT